MIIRFVALLMLIGSSSGQVGNAMAPGHFDRFGHQVFIQVTEVSYGEEDENGDIEVTTQTFKATGTLINNRFLLTAAHVFDHEYANGEFQKIKVSIQKGNTNINGEFSTRKIIGWKVHDSYSAAADLNMRRGIATDIAVAMLNVPVGRNVPTARLPDPNDNFVGDFAEVVFAGFGVNEINDDDELLEGKHRRLPVQYCEEMDREQQMYRGELRGKKWKDWKDDPDVVAEVKRRLETGEGFEQAERDFPDHICTGISRMDDDMSTVTKADSGCGLFKSRDQTSVVYGVASTCEHRWGQFAGPEDRSHQFAEPAAWVKVSRFVPWINDKMAELKRENPHRGIPRNRRGKRNPSGREPEESPREKRHKKQNSPKNEQVDRPGGSRGTPSPRTEPRVTPGGRRKSKRLQEKRPKEQNFPLLVMIAAYCAASYFL